MESRGTHFCLTPELGKSIFVPSFNGEVLKEAERAGADPSTKRRTADPFLCWHDFHVAEPFPGMRAPPCPTDLGPLVCEPGWQPSLLDSIKTVQTLNHCKFNLWSVPDSSRMFFIYVTLLPLDSWVKNFYHGSSRITIQSEWHFHTRVLNFKNSNPIPTCLNVMQASALNSFCSQASLAITLSAATDSANNLADKSPALYSMIKVTLK